jgi:predicted NUDIX family phosphoesterase
VATGLVATVNVTAERVLVVPTRLLHRLGYFQGFQSQPDRYLAELFHSEHASYQPRRTMETDPNFKQLIPYVIFRYTDPTGCQRLFQYTRGKGQGEDRLHDKRSVGVGGHIALADTQSSTGKHPYEEGMRRELAEEVVIETRYVDRCVGLINDDQTDVGKVHLGIVHLMDVAEPAVRPREAEIVHAGFQPVDEIFRALDKFESWSRICMQALFGSV